MNKILLKGLSWGGILLCLVLCLFYTFKTYKEGNTKWYFFVMAMGIGIMLTLSLMNKLRKK